jgi:putative heme iron utilization protein
VLQAGHKRATEISRIALVSTVFVSARAYSILDFRDFARFLSPAGSADSLVCALL